MRGHGIQHAAALCASAILAAAANASLITFESVPGEEGLGYYHGSMEWTAPGEGEDCGTLVVSLTNDSPVENGGFITGFAFQVVDGVTLAFAAFGDWEHISGVNAPPLGVFDHGAALGGNWLGGGSPKQGIAVGDSASFTFEVCGDLALLMSLGAEDFLDESNGYGFVARFRGFDDDGSDKVPAVTPSPGALALAALGGVALKRRKR